MSTVKYLYARDKDNFPVGTFAYKVVELDGKYLMHYAFSAFYMGDTYNRSFARDLTRGRLENSPLKVAGTDPGKMLASALRDASRPLANPWATSRSKMGHRFRSACARTAAKISASFDDAPVKEYSAPLALHDQLALISAFVIR